MGLVSLIDELSNLWLMFRREKGQLRRHGAHGLVEIKEELPYIPFNLHACTNTYFPVNLAISI